MVIRDATVAALGLAFGAAALYESSKLPFGTVRSPGQGFFPWWISSVIVALALLLMLQALTERSTTARGGAGRIAKVALLLVVLIAYTFLLDLLGYLLCTFFLVLFMLREIDRQRWTIALGMAAMTAAGSYILFAIWLSVPLPRGLL